MMKVCIETYKYNHPEVDEEKIIFGDINKNLKKIQNLVDKEIDVVIGAPRVKALVVLINKD